MTLRASPPAASTTQTCDPPSRADRNAMRLPSGLQRGRVSAAAWSVSRRGAAALAGFADTTQRSVLRVPASSAMSVGW